MKRAKPCAHQWERRSKGNRHVNARGMCARNTAHPSGYCSEHRYGYHWSEEQEAAYQSGKRRNG